MVELYELMDEIEINDTKTSLQGIVGYISKHDIQIKVLKKEIEEIKKQRMRDESTFWQALSDIMNDPNKAQEQLITVIKETIRSKWGKRQYVEAEAKKQLHNEYMDKIKKENQRPPSIADGNFRADKNEYI